MIDIAFINKHRDRTPGPWCSSDADGLNGRFGFIINGLRVIVVASDGSDPSCPIPWKHVSVSILNSCIPPSWGIMSKVKDIFWDEETPVMQLHPPKSQWINNHPGCLHLWEPLDQKIPLPPGITVGLPELNLK